MSIEEARISVAEDGGAVTVNGGGTLTFMNSEEFDKGLKQASISAERVLVDLRTADFIDTKIVQDLGVAAVTLLNRGKRLRVAVLEKAYPLRVIKISGYEELMDVETE